MKELDVDWNDLKLFLAVAREGSLSGAAKLTQKSPATLGRRMLALERSLKRELFHRHDKGYELLAEGKELLNDLAKIEPNFIRMTSPKYEKIKPIVKISAGTWTTLSLIQNLDVLAGTPNDINLRFVSTEKIMDINHREVVLGFRNKRPTAESLVCRKLSRIEFAFYSTEESPEYWIKVLSDTPSAHWLNHNIGKNVTCEVNIPRHSLDLAIAGKGIALLPTFIGDQQPQLKRRGGIINELSHDQWLVMHQDDRSLPQVRLLIERIYKITETST